MGLTPFGYFGCRHPKIQSVSEPLDGHAVPKGQPDGYALIFRWRHNAKTIGKNQGLWALSLTAFNAVWKSGKKFPKFPRRFYGLGKIPRPTATRTFSAIYPLRDKNALKIGQEHKRW